MPVGVLTHSKYYSFLGKSSDRVEYFTTTEEDQIINFIDTEEGNVQRNLNSLFVENVGDTTLYIVPLSSDYVLIIPPHESRNLDYVKVTGIQVLGNLGQMLRFSGCFY